MVLHISIKEEFGLFRKIKEHFHEEKVIVLKKLKKEKSQLDKERRYILATLKEKNSLW